MHEWALAESVIYSVMKQSRDKGLKDVDYVLVKLGELQQMDEEVFRFALKELKREKGIAMEIRMEREKSMFECRSCGHKWESAQKTLEKSEAEFVHFIPEVIRSYFKCPKCGSPDFKILKGRGISIELVRKG